jgi:hypothetical protein
MQVRLNNIAAQLKSVAMPIVELDETCSTGELIGTSVGGGSVGFDDKGAVGLSGGLGIPSCAFCGLPVRISVL